MAVTKIGIFFSEKEKKMQNILKWNNMQKYFATLLQGYPLKTRTFFSKFYYKVFSIKYLFVKNFLLS